MADSTTRSFASIVAPPNDSTVRFPTAVGLSAGDTGTEVDQLQQYLGRFNYLGGSLARPEFAAVRAAAPAPVAAPGVFDDATRRGLRLFQKFHGLPVTGKLDLATVTQMSMPRCGFPDVPLQSGRFVTQGNRWDKTQLTYKFTRFSAKLTEVQCRDSIRAAFDLWQEITQLDFSQVSGAAQADIEIMFVTGAHGDGDSFDGMGRVLAHAFFPSPFSGPLAGDVHFDEAEKWTATLGTTDIDLVTVAAHEIGHSLGLDHSRVQGSLMFPTYSGAHRFLHDDDTAEIRFLYGTRERERDPQEGNTGIV